MPTQLPDRIPIEPKPAGNSAAWIASMLAVGVLIGLTMRAPMPCETTADGGCVDVKTAPHFVQIDLARSVMVTGSAR